MPYTMNAIAGATIVIYFDDGQDVPAALFKRFMTRINAIIDRKGKYRSLIKLISRFSDRLTANRIEDN